VAQLDLIKQDVKLAVRSLVQEKGWVVVALLTLALGIGANSALFTIVNAVLIRPLPYPDSERLVSVSEGDRGVDLSVVSSTTYDEWSRSAGSFAPLAAYAPTSAVVGGTDEPEIIEGQLVTASYFPTMGMTPAYGRPFTRDEDRPGGPSVVVLSYQLWQRLFGGDSTLVGRAVLLDNHPTTVIAIMPRSFTTAHGPQYWTPMRLGPVQPGTVFYYFVVGRLRTGVSIERARAELAVLASRPDRERPVGERGRTAIALTLQDRRNGDTRPALLILFGAVAVLLLIACANVANLLLARGARRQKEFAVRRALGASPWQLVRYVLIESFVLSLAGGLLAVLVTYVAVDPLVRIAPDAVGRVEGIEIDATVLGFTFAVVVLTGVLFGLIPALDGGNVGPTEALSGSHASRSPRQRRLAGMLIVFELAIALVLLTCAGLLTRSFAIVMAIDPGVRPQGVVVANITLPTSRYSDASAVGFFTELLERVRRLPGVESAALADAGPLGGARMSFSMMKEDGKETPPVDIVAVSPGYLATVGTPLLAGRGFGPEDRVRAPRVAIVNSSLARLLYAGAQPIGRRIGVPGDAGTGTTIVGVMKDAPQRVLEGGASPALFVPIDQAGLRTRTTLLVRTSGDPEALRQPLRQAVRFQDGAVPAPTVTTLTQIFSAAVAPRRFSFALLAIFALLAGTLASVGLYGLQAYLVAERTREIGIRIALGATPHRLVLLVVRQGMRLVAIGAVIGFAGSLAAVKLLQHLLFGVSVYDPWAFALAAVLLGLVALAACWVPARRAATVQPATALRVE
jgi:putative ABC transport system permease protein